MNSVGTVRIMVNGKNIDVTPALREYSEKRIGKLNKFFKDREDVRVEVVLSVERDIHIAEVTYHLGGLLMLGESRTPDLYASIDEASDKIERQVRKYKNRLQKRSRVSPRFGDPPTRSTAAQTTDADSESDPPQVVRTKRFAVKPMDVEEAVLQMELLGHDFFVFVNAGTDEVNVLYRRKDGQYGLIESTLS